MYEEANLPKHIAIIMDGNRRWAKENKLAAVMGHKKGAETIREIVRYCNKIGIKYLTVYAFSTENWKRSKEEVEALMQILKHALETSVESANKQNIRIKMLGSRENISESLLKQIDNTIEYTKNNTGLTFNVAFNYGGRNEIVNAVKNIAKDINEGIINVEDITEDLITNSLYTVGMPDPDLMIRTSGELRTSNFLPWQLAYTEFYFTDKYWPEFTTNDLDIAIEEYNRRNRRFGAN